MEIPFWHERWKQNEIGFHQTEFNSHLQDFWPTLGVRAGSRVFVPLCGKSRDLLWLRAQGHTVLGVEISPLAVRDFFRENNLTPQVSRREPFDVWETDGLMVLCGDFFALSADGLRDIGAVYDRASLIALPPDLRARYAAHMVSILPQDTHILLVTMEYPAQGMQGPPFSVEENEVHALYEKHFKVTSLLRKDILAENARFRERGLNELHEHVYRLHRTNPYKKPGP
jgi:thiopurine S-methyltransferase